MKIQILDHGYIELIESWGSDERIIEAARMSTNKGFQGWGPKHTLECNSLFERTTRMGNVVPQGCNCGQIIPGDEKLLSYLYKNKHMTPFEMAGMIIEVQAPIFVFREWHRHRTMSYNELSARYTSLPDLNYIPTFQRCMINPGTNKQAQSNSEIKEHLIRKWLHNLDSIYKQLETYYQEGLSIGVPKELARLCIPVGRYSRMRASANLRNWLQFLTLRMAPNAQWEIRQYADAIYTILILKFPRTMQLFDEEGSK